MGLISGPHCTFYVESVYIRLHGIANEMNETFSFHQQIAKRWKHAKDKPRSDWRGLELRYDPSQFGRADQASGKQNPQAEKWPTPMSKSETQLSSRITLQSVAVTVTPLGTGKRVTVSHCHSNCCHYDRIVVCNKEIFPIFSDRSKRRERVRTELIKAGTKQKKGFMTPERKKKLRVRTFVGRVNQNCNRT